MREPPAGMGARQGGPPDPLGALALVGAWRDISDEEMESMIEEIYESRERDLGRPVELDV